ncbi:MAG TPA: tetratricopeptide repeat protein [Paludibacteraceae bacterium]|nr:tetratricopeptide repeat protein [Paludibacteraceae bacterium]HRU63077.1 tetratricopeptide repeat protein [Paludibacteraceae bacterium]
MSKKEKKKDEFKNVEGALTASEIFIEKYQKQILYVVGGIVLVVLLLLAARNFYIQPREKAAENEMYKAQYYFSVDSFQVALEGKEPEFIGFKQIVSEYGFTNSGKLAAAYAGICYYKLGDYKNAIKYLTQFDKKDTYFTTAVLGLIGDSYVELGEKDKALGYFEKAIATKNNVLTPVYLKKAGLLCESMNQPQKAEKYYMEIKENYPKSMEATDIDKYLARVQK